MKDSQDLGRVVKLLKSPVGKKVLPILKDQLMVETKREMLKQLTENKAKWTVESIIADIQQNAPKLLKVYALAGIPEEELVRLAEEAVREYENNCLPDNTQRQ